MCACVRVVNVCACGVCVCACVCCVDVWGLCVRACVCALFQERVRECVWGCVFMFLYFCCVVSFVVCYHAFRNMINSQI